MDSSLFVRSHLEPDRRCRRLVDYSSRYFGFISRILKLEIVKLLCQVSDENLQVGFGESLAKAHATATMEWYPALGVSLLPCRCQTERIAMVEPLRQHLHRSLPLIWVMTERLKDYGENITLLEAVLTECQVLLRDVELAKCSWPLHSKCLLHAHSGEPHFLGCLKCDNFIQKVSEGQVFEAWVLFQSWFAHLRVELSAHLAKRLL